MKERCEEVMEVEVHSGGGMGALLKGILIGGLVGAGLALLSAPRSGQETRDILVDRGNELKEKAQMKVDETRTKAEDLMERGTHQMKSAQHQGKSVLTEQKATVQAAVEGIKEGVRTYRDLNQTNPDGTDEAGAI